MNEPKTTTSAQTRPEPRPLPGDRKERLKAALKENLKRRKAQGRRRSEPDKPDEDANRA